MIGRDPKGFHEILCGRKENKMPRLGMWAVDRITYDEIPGKAWGKFIDLLGFKTVSARVDFERWAAEVTGFSPQFDEIAEGESVPAYSIFAIFNRNEIVNVFAVRTDGKPYTRRIDL